MYNIPHEHNELSLWWWLTTLSTEELNNSSSVLSGWIMHTDCWHLNVILIPPALMCPIYCTSHCHLMVHHHSVPHVHLQFAVFASSTTNSFHTNPHRTISGILARIWSVAGLIHNYSMKSQPSPCALYLFKLHGTWRMRKVSFRGALLYLKTCLPYRSLTV